MSMDGEELMDFQAVLQSTLDALQRRADENVLDEVRQLTERVGPEGLAPHVPDDHIVRGSAGQGVLATVPWIAVFPPDATTTDGIYLVYLFAADGSSVHLSLNQGVSKLGGGTVAATVAAAKRAIDIRTVVGEEEGLQTVIDLGGEKVSLSDLPRKYEAGNAYAVQYESGQIPSEERPVEDLGGMLALLSKVVGVGLKFLPELEPTHLVFKWNATRNPATVQIHKRIADETGSVWWGRFGRPGSRSISEKVMTDLRNQIDQVETHVYLRNQGEIWRTTLNEITYDPADVDDRQLPDYYSKAECNLFVRLSEFELLPAGWELENVTPSRLRNPEDLGKPEKMTALLGNQTNPVYVYEFWSQDSSDLAPTPNTPDTDSIRAMSMDWLEDRTLWNRNRLQEIVEALEGDSRQIVLAGPPGTGKTWVGMHLARYISKGQSDAVRRVQFHPNYSYEEFVEGLRPIVEDGVLTFKLVAGPVVEMAETARNIDGLAVVLIDEMNRANLPRVFGELMFLFEYREETLDLQYSPAFSLPGNLRFIGTMNTADRSIRSIDLALRRRFDVFECPPDLDILRRYFETNQNQVDDLFEGFAALNDRLTQSLDKHHQIGHTFFMAPSMTAEKLRQTWTRKLKPLIEEYFFDQPDEADRYELEEFWKPS